MTVEKQHGKNQEIQMLRGVAIAFVLIQHYFRLLPTPEWYEALFRYVSLWGGVDLFFAISGFVIAKAVLDKEAKFLDFRLIRPQFLVFWIKRSFRLLPAAWLWALASVAISPFLLHTDQMQPWLVLKGALAGMFGYANLYMAHCVETNGFGTTCPNPAANSIYWSLSREEQFYLCFSVLLLFVRFRHVLLIGLVFALVFAPFPHPAHSLIWHLRFEALFVGMCCYSLTRTPMYLSSWIVIKQRVTRVALLVAAIATIGTVSLWCQRFDVSIMALAGGVAVWVTSFDRTVGDSRIARVLAWIGDRSYAIYLCHFPAYLLIREVLMRHGMGGTWNNNASFAVAAPAALGLALIFAELTYRLVDLPLTRFGRSLAGRYAQEKNRESSVAVGARAG